MGAARALVASAEKMEEQTHVQLQALEIARNLLNFQELWQSTVTARAEKRNQILKAWSRCVAQHLMSWCAWCALHAV